MEVQGITATPTQYGAASLDLVQARGAAEEVSSTQSPSWSSFIQKLFAAPIENKTEEKRALPAIPNVPPLPRPKPSATTALEESLRQEKLSLSEGQILAACLQAFANQEELRSEAINVSQSLVEQHGKRADSLRDRYNELSKEIEEKAVKSNLLGWVSFGAGTFSAVFAIGSAAVVVTTGGGALPSIMGLASALSGTVHGVADIYDSFLKMDMVKHQAASLETKTLRDLNMEKIEQIVQNVQEDEQSIVTLWSERGDLLRNMPKVFNS